MEAFRLSSVLRVVNGRVHMHVYLASLAPLAKGVVVTIFPEEPLLLIRHVL